VAGFSFNISLGRETEFHNRVDGNDPANSALILVVLANAGLESDDVLKDFDTLAAVVAGTTNEVTNVGYARITVTDAGLAAYTVDDTLNEIRLPLANQVTAAITAGDSWRKLLICYDSDTTAGTDANIVPVKAFDILDANGAALTPNGTAITFAFPNGYHVSS